MSTKAIQNSIIFLVALTFLVPFVFFSETYFPYIVGKAIVFRSIVVLMLLLWAILVSKDSRFLPNKNGILISFALLTLFYLISAFLGESFRDSIFSTFERMGGWINTFSLFFFFLVTSSVIKSKKVWNSFFFIQIITSLILFLMGLKELLETGINTRIDASLGNPIYLSVIFLFSIFFALYLIFENYSKLIKSLLVISILINGLGVFFTGTRGAMVGLFVSGLVLLIYFLIRYFKKPIIRNSVIAILGLGILLPVLLFSFEDSSFVQNTHSLKRLTEINIQEGTGYARFINWGIAWNGIKENPIFGWGQENYLYVFDKHYDVRMYGQEAFFDSSHNTVLDVWVHGGILALLAYLSLFVFAILYIKRNEDLSLDQKFIISMLLLAYFIQNLFVFDNITSFILFFLILAFVVSKREEGLNSEGYKYPIVFGSIIIAIALSYYAIYIPWNGNTDLRASMKVAIKNNDGQVQTYYADGIKENLRLFSNAVNNNHTGILQSKAVSRSIIGNFSQLDLNENIMNDIRAFSEFSIKEMIEETKLYPNNAKVHYQTAVLFSQLGIFDEAEKFMQKAIDLSPNRQFYLLIMSDIKKRLNKEEERIQLLEKIYYLNKDNPKAWIDYLSSVVGDEEKLQKLLEEPINSEKAGHLIRDLDSRIQKDLSDPKLYINKAVLLSRVGLFEEAIKALDDFNEKFPDLSPQTAGWRDSLEKGEIPS